MTQTILIIVGIVVITVLLTQKGRQAVVGICAAALDQTVRKNANKGKILAFLRERGEVSNSDIREHLGVSSRTVVSYMDELEQKGRVDQIGGIGQGVRYRLKT